MTIKAEKKKYSHNNKFVGVEVKASTDNVPLNLFLQALTEFKDKVWLDKAFEQNSVVAMIKTESGRYMNMGTISKRLFEAYQTKSLNIVSES